MTRTGRIVVAGAGAIGCFTGGLLAAQGHRVTLLARARIIADIREHGLHLTDFAGLDRHVPACDLALTQDPACLSDAAIILVTVKTADTPAIAAEIRAHAGPGAVVISLQNGIQAADILRGHLPDADIRAGMVPFNVVPQAAGHFHRATSGDIVIGAGQGALARTLGTPDLRLVETARIRDVQWGKLLVNLNNALNALSGLTLQAQLLDRSWRRVMARQMAEALAVLRAHGIAPVSTTPLPAWVVPWVLRLPTPLFSKVAARMLTIDPHARTSMSYDLEAGKPTEIEALQGQIMRMGREKSLPTPICAKVAARIHAAEAAGRGSPHLSASDLS